MRCLSWNCWGLGNPRTVRGLRLLVKNNKPDLVFLMETKLMQSRASFLNQLLALIICLWWTIRVEVEASFCYGIQSGRFLSEITADGTLMLLSKWEFQVLFENLRAFMATLKLQNVLKLGPYCGAFLRCRSPTPWLCIGDFNEIISGAKTTSKAVQPCGKRRIFQQNLEDCQLLDIGFCRP